MMADTHTQHVPGGRIETVLVKPDPDDPDTWHYEYTMTLDAGEAFDAAAKAATERELAKPSGTPTNPWIKYEGGWPRCEPGDVLDVVDRWGAVERMRACSATWGRTSLVVRYRLAHDG